LGAASSQGTTSAAVAPWTANRNSLFGLGCAKGASAGCGKPRPRARGASSSRIFVWAQRTGGTNVDERERHHARVRGLVARAQRAQARGRTGP
jgi:hypothetical protein